jgi:hypothetical protein
MRPDFQYFEEDGIWVKPPGAVRADIVLQGAGQGGCRTYAVIADRGENVFSASGGDGENGQITVRSFPAPQLPDLVPVTIGTGGRPGGQDGYALIVTHLAFSGSAADGTRLSGTLYSVPATDEDLTGLAGHFSNSFGKVAARWAAEKNTEIARLRAEICRLQAEVPVTGPEGPSWQTPGRLSPGR